MKNYKLLYAIFQIRTADETLAVTRYVKLVDPITNAQAVKKLRRRLISEYRTNHVTFLFFATRWVNHGGAPLEVRQ